MPTKDEREVERLKRKEARDEIVLFLQNMKGKNIRKDLNQKQITELLAIVCDLLGISSNGIMGG